MRRPRRQPLVVTAEERRYLEHLIATADMPPPLVIRAWIILTAAAHPEQSSQQIATTVGTTAATVRTWCRRWLKTRTLTNHAPWRIIFLPLGVLP